MGRVEENSEVIAPIVRAVSSPYAIGSVKSKEFELSLLCDISKSLAIIAETLNKENREEKKSASYSCCKECK